MSATVWKETLAPGLTDISVPAGAELLSVDTDSSDCLCVWFRCDPHGQETLRRFAVVTTGVGAPEAADGRYVGSAVYRGVRCHVFERIAVAQKRR